jgi:glutathione S-transferase
MIDLWEREIGHPLMQGSLNRIHLTLACTLGLEARNPGFQWRAGHPKLVEWYAPIAARPSFAATVPPG